MKKKHKDLALLERIPARKPKELCKTARAMANNTKNEGTSAIQRAEIEKQGKREMERLGPPKFKLIKEKTVCPIEKNLDKNLLQMKETTGSSDTDLSQGLLTQMGATFQTGSPEDIANFVAAFMHGLRPRDEMEGVLITQMAGTHNLIMDYMRRAMIPGQILGATNDYTDRAFKLMNIYLRQVEALEKYRGKRLEQKVIVKHVHIHEGGKAIVGHVENRPRGEGDDQENRG
jgi:hypothetical protein